jgi:hypothetical protein
MVPFLSAVNQLNSKVSLAKVKFPSASLVQFYWNAATYEID